MNLDTIQSELTKVINKFWLKFIDEPIEFEKLIVGHKVKEEIVENQEMVCKPIS